MSEIKTLLGDPNPQRAKAKGHFLSKKIIRKSIRISEEENQKLLEQLKKHDIDFSEFCRARIFNYKIHSNIDIEFLRQVQKIGTNLNQIAKIANTNRELKIETLQSLVQIEKTLKMIVDDL